MSDTVLIITVGIFGLAAYFLPSYLARKKKHFKKIFILNIFGAWTGLLWALALVLALFLPDD
jgi:hypothetical protein